MTFGTGPRVLLGLGLAAIAIAVLQWCVAVRGEAAGDRPPPAADDGPLLVDVLLPVGEADRVVLAAQRSGVPADAAPVVEIGGGGAVRILVAAPPPAGPLPEPWPSAGVVLPQSSLAALDPRERARLLEVLAAWGGPRGASREQLHWVGVAATAEEVERLLRWLR